MSVVEPNVLEMLPRTEDRYTMVIAAAKRAREIVAETETLGETNGKKPLQTAIEEINSGLLTYERPVDEEEQEEA